MLGVLLSMKHELRVMQAQGAAASSISRRPWAIAARAGASLYVASKHAVEGIDKIRGARSRGVRCARQRGSAGADRDRRCWTASPAAPERKAGLVAGVPLKRAGRPEEIADAIVFASSEKASFITGQIIDVNGGKTAS